MSPVQQACPADTYPLDALEVDFFARESSDRLTQGVRQTVQNIRRRFAIDA